MEVPALNLMSPYAFLYRPRFPDRDEPLLYPVIFIILGLYAAYNGSLNPVAVFITSILKRQKRGVSANTAGIVGTRTKKDAHLRLMLNIRPNIMYIWENDLHCSHFLCFEKNICLEKGGII